MNKIFIGLALTAGLLSSCRNKDKEFSDYTYQTVYFANQFPVRTVELGEDLFMDNSIDNLHKVMIKATMGGVYENNKNILIDFAVDTTLCRSLYFTNGPTKGSKVIPMPSGYYQLASNQISISSGSLLGGVEVQLTDAFFADTLSVTNTYAIPLVMTNEVGVDSILQGSPVVSNPDRLVDANWAIKPKDYVLYLVKFVNPWHGNYLRRGIDVVTRPNKTDSISKRDSLYVEKSPVVSLVTKSMSKVSLPLTIKNNGTLVNYTLILTFADDGTCIVGSGTTNVTVTGTGSFVSKGEKNSFGGKDRDGLYLDYNVNFTALNLTYATKDTLVVRDRGVKADYFTVVKK